MKYDWSEQRVRDAVKKSLCWWDCMRELGVPIRGCNYKTLKQKVALYNIDTSHFDYKYARTHNGKRILRNRNDSEVFNNSTPIKNSSLKRVYIERILNNSPHCECCGISSWNNNEITFQLHHKDGNCKNNVIDNLILLCPNCHSQTENYRNNKR